MKKITVNLPERGYDINIGAGLIRNLADYMNLDRRVFIVTDSGVPSEYAERVRAQAKNSLIHTVNMGEGAKSIEVWEKALKSMLSFGMDRKDCVVAVGGGVVGDLAGFLAASYMRGIDFYNIPTTTLSMVDSSVGGKVAINLSGVKNSVGAFYQPRAVVIDTDLLASLDKRLISEGLAEAIKMSLTSDAELFSLFENTDDISAHYEEIIYSALMIKKGVVEADEKESGIRKILNLGHTLGHAIEGGEAPSGLYHGECVSLGMIPMCSDKVRERLIPVLKKLSLPTEYKGDIEAAISLISHDKKCDGEKIDLIFVSEIGKYEIVKMDISEYANYLRSECKEVFGI